MESLALDASNFVSSIDSSDNDNAEEILLRIEKYLTYVNLSIDDNWQICSRILCKALSSLRNRTLVESIDYSCCVFRCIEVFSKRKFGGDVFLDNPTDLCKSLCKPANIHKYNYEIAIASCLSITALTKYLPQLYNFFVENGFMEYLLFFTQCYVNKTSKLAEVICNCLSSFLLNCPGLCAKLPESMALCSSLIPGLTSYKADVTTVCSILNLVTSLCDEQPLNVTSFMENSLGNCLLEMLKESDQGIIVEYVFKCLVILTKIKKWAVHIELSDPQLCDILVFNVKTHSSQFYQMTILYCGIITNLSAIRSVRVKLIDDNVVSILESALIHDLWEVRSAACLAVAALAVDTMLSQRLIDLGICHLLLECLRIPPDEVANQVIGEWTSKCVAASCVAIAALSKDAALALGERGTCQQILAVIQTCQNDANVLAKAFSAVRELILNYTGNMVYFKALDPSHITSSLLLHGEDPDVWEYGLAALVHVMKKKDDAYDMHFVEAADREAAEDNDLCNVILKALGKFKEHRNIIVNTCWCVMTIMDTKRNCAKLLARTGLCEVIVEALRVNIRQARIAERCCDVIRVFTVDLDMGAESRRNLLCAGALECMTAVIDNCSKDAELVRSASVALNLLLTIGQDGALLRDRIAYADTYSIIVRLLRSSLSPTAPSSVRAVRRGLEVNALLVLLGTLIQLDALEQKVDQIGLTASLMVTLEDFVKLPASSEGNEALFKLVTDTIHALVEHNKTKSPKKAGRQKVSFATGVEE